MLRLQARVRGARLFSSISSVSQINKSEVEVTIGTASYTFHAPWLAHNCSCPKCRQPSSGQRLAQPSSQMTLESATTDGKKLAVEFNKGHVGEFSADWLIAHKYDDLSMHAQSVHLSALNRASKLQPYRVDFKDANKSRKSILEWTEAVINHGVVIVENTPPVEGTLLNFIEPTGCESSHRLYGTTFVVEATTDPINVAYSSEALEPHQDLAYYESPPGIQILHCLEFDERVEGGLSTFVDGHAVAEILKEQDPKAFADLCRIPATFQKDHVRRADPAKMYYQRPHIMTNDLNDVIGVFWAPAFEGPLQVPSKDVMAYFEAYDKFKAILSSPELQKDHGLEFKLRKGDMVIFNNRRYLHGRTKFTVPPGSNGRRKLHGCYLEMDRFLNRIRVMHWEESQTETYVLKARPGISTFRV